MFEDFKIYILGSQLWRFERAFKLSRTEMSTYVCHCKQCKSSNNTHTKTKIEKTEILTHDTRITSVSSWRWVGCVGFAYDNYFSEL